MKKIISVHAPKCAGSSFRCWLIQSFGEDNIYFDYDDMPVDPMSIMYIDPERFEKKRQQDLQNSKGKRVIHGHFWVDKYKNIADAVRITFLRDPVSRTISHYFFWQKITRVEHSLYKYVVDNNLSLIEFAQLPFIKYFYTKVFFRDVDMEQFDFIGKFEQLQNGIDQLNVHFDTKTQIEHINKTVYNNSVELSDPKTLSCLKELLHDDIAFYEKWTKQKHDMP